MSEIPEGTALVFIARPSRGFLRWSSKNWSSFGKALLLLHERGVSNVIEFLKSAIYRPLNLEKSSEEEDLTHLQRAACGGSIMMWGCFFFSGDKTHSRKTKSGFRGQENDVKGVQVAHETRIIIHALTPPPISGISEKSL